jgi:hypothetical protein
LEDANIVCTTLSFSGSPSFIRLAHKFDVLIVDEAAQAVEPSILVPLAQCGAKQVYLVGDPVQLPATVMSQRALLVGYSESLFKRFQEADYPVQVLDMQYRMHPLIREFPSVSFYDKGLKDGPGVEENTTRPWHSLPAFKPFVFYDVPGKVSGCSCSTIPTFEVIYVLLPWLLSSLTAAGVYSTGQPITGQSHRGNNGGQHFQGAAAPIPRPQDKIGRWRYISLQGSSAC